MKERLISRSFFVQYLKISNKIASSKLLQRLKSNIYILLPPIFCTNPRKHLLLLPIVFMFVKYLSGILINKFNLDLQK